MVVVRKQGNREQRLTVLTEVGADVTDTQPPLGIGVVAVRLGADSESRGLQIVPAPVFRKNGRRVVIGMIIDRVREIAVRNGVGRTNLDGPAEALDRFVDAAGVFCRIAQVAICDMKLGS